MTEDIEITIKEIEDALVKYETETCGLPLKQKMEAPKYLFMSIEELRKLGIDEVTEATYIIAQYSFYIQRLINQNSSWMKWAKLKIDEVSSHYIFEVDKYLGSYERMHVAKHGPEICKRLNSILRMCSARVERLHATPENIKIIADSLKDFKFTLLRKMKDGEAKND